MNDITKADFDRLFNKVESLTKTIQDLVDATEKKPDFLPLTLLVKETNKTRQTIRNYLYNNYEPEVDFKVENSKILINSKVFVFIKDYYDNKNK